MIKSLTSFFDPDLSDDFISRWADFLGIPADDALTRSTAQIMATHYELNMELRKTVDDAVKMSGQWQSVNNNAIAALTITLETVGKISICHQKTLQELNTLTAYCEKLESNNHRLVETMNQSQRLYQESLSSNQNLQESYEKTQQQNHALLIKLDTLISGLGLNNQHLKDSQRQGFQSDNTEVLPIPANSNSSETNKPIVATLKMLVIAFFSFLSLNIAIIAPACADVTMQQLSSRLPFLNKSIDGLPSVNGVKPQDYLQIGNLGLGRTNLAGMGNATGIDSNKVSVTDLKGVLSGLKVQDLVNNKLSSDPRFNYQSKTLEQVPLLADLSKQLNLNLPGTTKISEIIKLPNFANASLGNVSPQVANLPIGQAIPNFTQLPFGAINNLEKAPISAFGGFNLQKMAFNQFPLSGAGLNVGLARMNYTATGERVVQASRNACGGIPQPSFQVKAETCTGTCKGFELLGSGSLNGSMCVEHQVPDGHGPLALPTGGRAKSGNFPAGRELGLHLTNINNRDQATLTVNFQTCLYLPFVTDPWTCSSHVLPIPDGIPVMSIGRNTLMPFQAPSTLAAAPSESPLLAQGVDKDQEITHANWGLFYRSDYSRGA